MALDTEKYKGYNQDGLAFLANNGTAVPGQSLTTDPEQPLPFEGPPVFTELSMAIDATFIEITELETYLTLMSSIAKGVPIGDLTQILLYDGFSKGLWNPDLMLLLIEPVMYMLLGLAEQAGIPNPILYRGEEEEGGDPEEEAAGFERAIEVAKAKVIPRAKKGQLPTEIAEKIEEFEPEQQPSLLAPTAEPTEAVAQPNLLEQGTV